MTDTTDMMYAYISGTTPLFFGKNLFIKVIVYTSYIHIFQKKNTRLWGSVAENKFNSWFYF